MNEEELCELILDNVQVLTCFNCGETLTSQRSVIPNDERVGILHIDPGEKNYPHEPDIPALAYFECMQCYERERIEEATEDADLMEQIEEGKKDDVKIQDFEELAEELGI